MKIDSLLGGEVLVGSSPPMNIKRDLSIQMHTKHTKRALQKYSDVSNIECLKNIRSTFCKVSRNYFMLSFEASDPLFFGMQLNFEETILSN